MSTPTGWASHPSGSVGQRSSSPSERSSSPGHPSGSPSPPAGPTGARSDAALEARAVVEAEARPARLDVSPGVVLATARLAAREVPGVARIGRGGSVLRRFARGGPALRIAESDGGLDVRLVVVARPGRSLGALGRAVGAAVRGSIERVLGLEVARVTVVVDGVG